MTTFDRRGHWRTNSNGTMFWVSGHSVSRNDWDRFSYGSHTFNQAETEKVVNNNKVRYSTYESFINPNSKCPVCGAQVYYYESTYGGRVYFDSLGPPWPKHPCTDNSYTKQPTINYKIWIYDNWEPFVLLEFKEFNSSFFYFAAISLRIATD